MSFDSKESERTALLGLSAAFIATLSFVAGAGVLRRSFSHFVRGWPGTGLLLIRSLIGFTIIDHEARLLLSHAVALSSAGSIALIVCGILLIIGLWTPIAGILAGLLQVPNFLHCIDPWTSMRLGIFASALAMIGPGGWSVDARLFGWKRLEVPARVINPPTIGSAE